MHLKSAEKSNDQIRFTSNVLRSVGITNDALCLLLAYFVAGAIYQLTFSQFFVPKLHQTGAIVLSINFFLIRVSRDSYSALRGQGDDAGQGVLFDFALAAILTTFTVFLLGMAGEFSRGLSLIYMLVSAVFLFISRVMVRQFISYLMKQGTIGQRVAIYGADRDTTARVLHLLEMENLPHLRIIGFADSRDRVDDRSAIAGVESIGGIADLVEYAQNGRLDQVIIALPKVTQQRLDSIIEQLSVAAIDICCIPREILELDTKGQMNFLGSMPVFSIWQRPMRDFDSIGKGFQDRFLALIGLILLSPLLLLTAIAIKLESKGDIIFVQKRFGFNNLEIGIYKFRSMYTDLQDATGEARTLKNDHRVTRVGRIIRRLSIDELPQLFNVLRGEMSLVGPRPHATQMRVEDKYYFDAVKGYSARHRVKPGITGLAQVRGLRGEIATIERAKKRVEYDTYYIDHWSPLLDIRIILETLLIVVWDRNAY
jgi:polysaccharide biosynthesis protein PslA